MKGVEYLLVLTAFASLVVGLKVLQFQDNINVLQNDYIELQNYNKAGKAMDLTATIS